MSRTGASRDDDMDEEMRLHVALLVEQNVAAGMTPVEARRAALLRFGPGEAIREAARAGRPLAWLRDLGRDAAHAARALRRDAAFTVAVVATMALGIGACAAIFSVVDAVLLRPLPYPQPEQLVVLKHTNPPRFPELVVLPGPFLEWQRQAKSFEGLAAVRTLSYNLGGGAQPERVAAARLTANTLSVLRVRPALGRDFLPEEDTPGKGNVAILGHGFWQRHFGGRADALGATITLDGQPFVVVGVMPRGFAIDAPLDLFVPAAYAPDDPQLRRSLGVNALEVIGRLAPGVTLAQARAEMALIAGRAATPAPAGGGHWSAKVTPMLEARVGSARPVLLSLLGAVGFLLLIACVNVANLLLARASARRQELAVRAALGAGPGRIVRQLLTESLLLSLAGGLLGLLLAHAGTGALVALAPGDLPRAADIAVDARAAAFAFALALLAGVGFGLAPAWGATRLRLRDALTGSGRRAGESGGRRRLRRALVVAEVAIALVLLAGAGLLIRSVAGLGQAARGFEPRDAVTFGVSLPNGEYGTDPQRASFAERATQRLAALPGVTAAGASQALPFSIDLNIVYFAVADRPLPAEWPTTYVFEVTPGYFAAMGIPLRRGRLFDARDREGNARVGIINETVARRYFPGEDPIGRRVGSPDRPPETWSEIVGVVADVKDGRVYGLNGGDGAAVLQAYVPFAQNPYDALSFVVRGAGDAGLPAAIRAAIADVDRDQPITAIRPLAELAAEPVARQRFAMFLFAVFSGAALLLAAVGIYGVMATSVAQRTGELAIRVALGARPGQVRRLVLAEGARLYAIGVAVGLLGALLLTRSLTALLYGVTPQDPLTLGGATLVLALVAALACLLPALRATRVDPMRALRAE
jgi:putative ABC transport system permease protein